MESFDAKNYRDNLAEDLRKIRNFDDPKNAEEFLSREKKKSIYKRAKDIHTGERFKNVTEIKRKEDFENKIVLFGEELEQAGLKSENFDNLIQVLDSLKNTLEGYEGLYLDQMDFEKKQSIRVSEEFNDDLKSRNEELLKIKIENAQGGRVEMNIRDFYYVRDTHQDWEDRNDEDLSNGLIINNESFSQNEMKSILNLFTELELEEGESMEFTLSFTDKITVSFKDKDRANAIKQKLEKFKGDKGFLETTDENKEFVLRLDLADL